ncbi:MAG: hypothetical protein CMJ47_06310 [Planctomyces sp.]|nr:hypothetical protein [Planctomyces sp.]
MIPKTLKNAIHEIEDYERESSWGYGVSSEDIAIAKKVMATVMERLQQPSSEDDHLDVAEALSYEQRELWRTTCEAEIARWARGLHLLEPVVGEELVGKLHDAVQRQDTLMEKQSH